MITKKLRTIRSHSGLARFIAECSEEPVAYAPRCETDSIPSPYRYSSVTAVYEWNGRHVVWFETAHRRFEVYAIAAGHTFKHADDAEVFNEFAMAERGRV
jgi:hypothetical protein